jgi:arylsulfatase A-like enzyme
LDEEVHVPTWIDAPEGTLTLTERQYLQEKRDAFTFHPDLTATILDLLGVWNRPEVKEHQDRMVGTSLLGSVANTRALPMTNCSPLWSCAFENWGVMQENMKLEARAWDSEYHCWDLRSDPNERVNLGAAACPELRAEAERKFGRLPGKKPAESAPLMF